MSQKLRSAVSYGGPNLSDSMWTDNGETGYFAAITSTSTPTFIPISIVPQDTSSIDNLPGLTVGASINRLQGGQYAVISGTGMAVQPTLNLGLVIVRKFCTLSAQLTNAGGAITSLPVTAVVSPIPSGASLTITNATPTLQTWVTTAAVLPGATAIPVTSQTPSATFPAGLGVDGFVGGGSATAPAILFGWVVGGTGTPAFAAYQSYLLPAITANIVAGSTTSTGDPYGPFVPKLPGDITTFCAFSAGSITVSAGAASSLVS
jgi:hypothetical protein